MKKESEKFKLEYCDNGAVLRSVDSNYAEVAEYKEDNHFGDIEKLLGKAAAGLVEYYEDCVHDKTIECHEQIHGYDIEITIQPITDKRKLT